MSEAADRILWHPGFRSCLKISFRIVRNGLSVWPEYQLSDEAIRMDILIKKDSEQIIDLSIGRIFRKHNIIEYKSPDDNLSIDDYYKTLAYACLYKGLGATVDAIPGDELTVSIFRYRYPRKLFEDLKRLGAKIEKHDKGVYYVSGIIHFPTQIIVIKELPPKEYAALRVLTRDAKKEDIREFIRQAREFTEPGDRNDADAVFQVSAAANMELYEEIRKETGMCEALRYLMRDEIEAGIKAEREAGKKALEAGIKAEREAGKKALEVEREAGKKALEAERAVGEKKLETSIITNISNLMKTVKFSAEQAMDALLIPEEDREKYASRL